MLLLLPMVAVVVALVLIVYGYRGRRVGDQPVCKRCGFDLSGKPSTSILCSECGSDLGEVGAVAYGEFHRRKGVLVTGLVMFFFFGAVAGSKAGTIKTLRYAPFRWVAWRSCSSDAELRNAAHAEMDRRVSLNALSDDNWAELVNAATAYQANLSMPGDDDWGDLVKQARQSHHLSNDRWRLYVQALAHRAFFGKLGRQSPAFVELYHRQLDGLLKPDDLVVVQEELLACQADPSKPWNTEWGDWIEVCHSSGQLDAQRWLRYFRQALNGAVTLKLRPRVRMGDPLPFVVAVNVTRAGSQALAVHLSDLRLQWAGSANPTQTGVADTDLIFDWARKYQLVLEKDLPPGLAAGMQSVHLTAMLKSDSPGAPSVVTEVIDLPGSFELLPASVPSVTTVQNRQSGLGPLIEFPPVVRVSGSEHPTVKCVVIVNDPPVGLAFDVILNNGDKGQIIGSFSCPAHAVLNRYVFVAPWRFGDVDQVDVTLHSNPAAAANTVDTIEIWDGDIPYTQVPVAFQ